MFRPTPPTRRPARRGVTLIVVLALLSLLALVGIAAVYFAKDQAERARIQPQDTGIFDDGTAAANAFLSALLYDARDDGQGLLNAMRGHSLMATMYGRPQAGQSNPTAAWSGPGTFDENATAAGVNRRQLVNHRLFQGARVYDPEYSNPGGRAATDAVTGTFIGKNAPYTYPDVKDFYLAAMCPATGEVLVPSFHRQGVFGSLDPSNPNWNASNPQGKYLTLRPRPADHSGFPPVPQNADGTRTGDVQNLPGGFFRDAGGAAINRNDSIWIDIGLAPITLPSGRRVKPLVAALILDLDGRLNLNVHGNVLNGGAHASGKGLGPWEISLEKALAAQATGVAEARNLVNYRRAPRTRAPLTVMGKAFAPFFPPGNEFPQYAPVAWSGFNSGPPTAPDGPLVLPGTPGVTPPTLFATAPRFGYGYTTTNTPINNHPSLWNPGEWPNSAGAGTDPRSFPLTDNSALHRRYAPPGSVANQLSFASSSTAPNTLVGGVAPFTGPTPNPPAAGTPNSSRADPAHAIRQIFTTRSESLDRAGLTPDLGQARNPLAGLPPVNLSRQLADYRTDPAQPLSSMNAGNAANADLDRQQFASDIFVRLLIAASAPGVNVVPATGAYTVTGTTPAELDPLRRYAQLAANIVDYIDSDDVSTAFTWNPAGATLGDKTVFGVEKPRLVVTEAYAEMVNDPTDTVAMMASTKDAHLRFWLEFQNPTSTPYTSPTGGPLGDGSVKLRDGAVSPYQVEIVRNAKGGANVLDLLRNPANPANPGNVTGGLSGLAPDLTFDFSTAAADQPVAPADGDPTRGIVVCAAEVPALMPMTRPDFNPMFALPGTVNGAAVPMAIGGGTNSLGYPLPLPDAAGLPATLTDISNHVVLLRRLANPYLAFNAMTNPYVTVDVVGHVRAADRLLRKKNEMMDRMPKTGMMDGYEPKDPPTGTDPDLRPQARGKVQPYAAFSPEPLPSPANFPVSMVLGQDPATVTGGVRHTFGRQNSRADTAPATATFDPTAPGTLAGNETLMTPYDWLVHPDRPLVNSLELLHVADAKPHELTTRFIRPDAAGTGVVRQGHTVRDAMLNSPLPLPSPAPPALHRALDLLRVQPFGHQTAVGGRVPGRININTIQDVRVLRALFDDQGYNRFPAGFVDNLWATGGLMGTRTRTFEPRTDATGGAGVIHSTPIPGPTVYDDPGNPNADRPFLSFGAANVPNGGYTIGSATVFQAGVGIDDTLLRRNSTTTPPQPWLAVSPGPTTHPYEQDEAVSKIMNNTTTVSHTFAVWVTVGYFEVDGNPTPSGVPGVPDFLTLGREYYLEAPGDTRRKFFGVVDRSMVGMDAASFLTNPTAPTHATVRPFFTTLEANAPQGATSLTFSAAPPTGAPGGAAAVVYADGVAVDVAAGSTLVVGTGDTREIVTVSGVTYNAGQATATVPALARSHTAGESVSNVVSGNPGPQPAFDPLADKYKPVVPLWGKVQ